LLPFALCSSVRQNLFFPHKFCSQYLRSGAPGSGKSTLLRYIANNLFQSKDHFIGGEVSLTGVTPAKGVIWTNLVAYIDQIDRLHPFLTVFETCKFAWLCRSGGTHRKPWFGQGEEVEATIEKMDAEMSMVNKILEGVGLSHVKDTFVGDQNTVRGVSGGEKKRVTVAEMLCAGTPVFCCDEISTGLDGKLRMMVESFLVVYRHSNRWLLL
jgi:ABC-type multidrug transport system ATPase subunit